MRRWLLLALWAAVMLFGLWGVYLRLTTGHELAGYGNFVTWGLWVSTYIWFVGLSAGSFLLSSLIYVLGMRQLEPIGKLALFTALVTLLVAMLVIWFDIGHMERVWELILWGQWTSMMAWMGWLYSAYFLLLVVEFWFAMRQDLARWADRSGLQGHLASVLTLGQRSLAPAALARDRRIVVALGTVGVPLAVAFHGGVGALFGVVMARPYWNTPIYPIAFVVGALLSGTAFFSVLVAFFWPRRDTVEYRDIITLLGRFTLGLLAFYLLLEWAEFSIGMYYGVILNPATPGEARSFWLVVGGPYPWVFWVIHLALGSALPLVLLAARPHAPWAVGGAGILIAVSFLAVRLNIVIPALVIPQLPGLESAYVDPRLTTTYFPSLMEWQIFALVIALAGFLLYLGYRYLPLMPEQEAVP